MFNTRVIGQIGKKPKPYGEYVNACDCCGRTNYALVPFFSEKYGSMLDLQRIKLCTITAKGVNGRQFKERKTLC